MLKGFLPREIESFRLDAKSIIDVDIGPEVFVYHYSKSKAQSGLYILKKVNIRVWIIGGDGIYKHYTAQYF